MNRLLEPDHWQVLIGGRSVMGDDPDALRQRVGMVFQHFNLFPHKSVPGSYVRLVPEPDPVELAEGSRVRLVPGQTTKLAQPEAW